MKYLVEIGEAHSVEEIPDITSVWILIFVNNVFFVREGGK